MRGDLGRVLCRDATRQRGTRDEQAQHRAAFHASRSFRRSLCSAKAAITADEGLKLVSAFPAPEHAGAECRFRPLGVFAVLGPFNFPVHLSNGHILPALACGNAVVFKPSEIAPQAAEVYARCLEAAGVPRGVFNLVQGGPAVGAESSRACPHEELGCSGRRRLRHHLCAHAR